VGASPAGVLALLAVVTAVFSALLDNVTTVLLMVPVTLVVTQELEVPPYPFLFAEVFASNLGGTATLIGDPPNIMIGSAAGLTFNDFVVNLTPVIVVTMLVQLAAIQLIWGRRLHTSVENRARVMAMDPRVAITDWRLLRQSLAVLFTVLVAFVCQRALHLQPGTIAVFGATVLLLLDSWWRTSEEQTHHVHGSLSDLEWITLFFFVGLFVVVSGVERAGLLHILAQKALALTGGEFNVMAVGILWASAVLSAVIDNIPFVVTMIPLVKELGPSFGGAAHLLPLWWALSLGACLGGNGTLIGASANLTVAGIAERKGVRFSFWTYTKTAFPLMLLTVAIAHLYLYLRYLR
jgi:Na+/H+ antiporter NhaD/arsenite permease-like protein